MKRITWRLLCALVMFVTLAVGSSCTDGDSMRRQLQALQALNQADSLLTDLPQATALCRYFDRHGTPNERMLAHYLLGRTYADLGEAPQALEEYHAAAECADTLNIDSMGAHHLSRVYGQMGELFYKQELYHNALQSISLADHYASMCKETLIATNYYSQLAKCYYHLEKIDSAIYVSEQAARRFYEQKDTLSGNTCLGLVAYHCLRSGDLEKGKDCLVKYEKHSYLSEEAMKYNESWRLLYVYKGLFFQKSGQSDSALYYYNKTLQTSSDPSNRALAYRGLYETYAALGKENLASQYAIRYAEANDSTSKLSLASTLLSLEHVYNYSKFRELSNRKTIEAKNLHLRFVYLAVITIIVIFILGLAYLYQVQRKKLLRQRMNSKYASDILMFINICSNLESQKAESDEQKLLLENELSAIRKSLTSFQEDQKAPEQWGISMEILNTPIVKHFHQMALQGKTVSDDSWHELRSLCNFAMPDFIDDLLNTSTGYSPNFVETQICLLVKLRFLMSEIGAIVQLSPSALSKKRVRLLKKMFGIEGSSIEFDEKIRQLGLHK